MMDQSDIDMYESTMVEVRPYAKWHPWAQVAVWISDWEFAHHYGDWTLREMRTWIKRQLQENEDMTEEVNSNPLHDGLIYPMDSSWISYVLRDMIKLRWVYRDRFSKKYHSISIDAISYPAEWLASQIGSQCSEEMDNRNMPYDSKGMKPDYDLGYTREWEAIVNIGLLDAPQWLY